MLPWLEPAFPVGPVRLQRLERCSQRPNCFPGLIFGGLFSCPAGQMDRASFVSRQVWLLLGKVLMGHRFALSSFCTRAIPGPTHVRGALKRPKLTPSQEMEREGGASMFAQKERPWGGRLETNIEAEGLYFWQRQNKAKNIDVRVRFVIEMYQH